MVKVINKKDKLKLSILLIITILLILTLLFTKDNILKKENTYKDNLKNEEVVEEVYKASMIMAGDNLIHSSIYKDAYFNGIYDFTKMYELIKPIVKEYDIAYYNQETILGGIELGLSDYPTFNSPKEVGDAMIDAGFNLVSLATNHTMDKGESAVINSRNYWNSKENVLAVGSYSSFDEKNQIKIAEVNNITYTMLNYTYGTNGINVPSGKEYLVNIWPTNLYLNDYRNDTLYQEYKKQVKQDIESVRDKVDILLVAMHWGVEYQTSPNSYQKDMAEYLSSLGVDIIIGTHPHVIQPIEWINDTLVIYSLGNFISAHEVINIGNRVGLMSSIDIKKTVDGDNISITIDNLSNELLYTYYTSNYKDIKVIPFSHMNSNYLPNYTEVYEKYKNIVISLDNNISVKPLS